jgi:hypothetical protein
MQATSPPVPNPLGGVLDLSGLDQDHMSTAFCQCVQQPGKQGKSALDWTSVIWRSFVRVCLAVVGSTGYQLMPLGRNGAGSGKAACGTMKWKSCRSAECSQSAFPTPFRSFNIRPALLKSGSLVTASNPFISSMLTPRTKVLLQRRAFVVVVEQHSLL